MIKRFLQALCRWVQGDGTYGLDRLEGGRTADLEPMRKTGHHERSFSERLSDWILHKEEDAYDHFYRLLSFVFALLIILSLLITVSFLPQFGEASNPANNEVSRRYITQGIKETGAINFVSGMILDYRAFDTLGESHVLFIAASAVLILLRNDRKKRGKNPDSPIYEPGGDLILQRTAGIQIPLIMMFGIYIILNGHLSPGGGFSGGTILGAALIVLNNAYGTGKVRAFFTYRTFRRICLAALAFYAFAKSYSFFTGANHIESLIPLGTPGSILSAGLILPLNIAVGIVVCCTMYGFYALFSRGEI